MADMKADGVIGDHFSVYGRVADTGMTAGAGLGGSMVSLLPSITS